MKLVVDVLCLGCKGIPSLDDARRNRKRWVDQDLDRIKSDKSRSHPASAWIELFIVTKGIEFKRAKALIAGMRIDLQPIRIANESDLNNYYHRVAGTVGLMITRLMGVKNWLADRHAIALGVAMQLTIIARDARE